MKKFLISKVPLLHTGVIACVMLVASCNNGQNPEGSKAVAEDNNNERFDSKNEKDEAKFLVSASQTNMEIIQFGQLAQQKGKSSQVKELSKKMEESHTKSRKELVMLAKVKNISLPSIASNETKDAHNMLDKKYGDDFDKAYFANMIDTHEDAIANLETAVTDTHDTAIKDWAIAALADYRKHLEYTRAMQNEADSIRINTNLFSIGKNGK